MVFIGYFLLKKLFYDVFVGFIKVIVGYLILNVGVGGLVNIFCLILVVFVKKFNLEVVVIDFYFGLVLVNVKLEIMGFISVVIIVFLIGFGINIFLVVFCKVIKVCIFFIIGYIMV